MSNQTPIVGEDVHYYANGNSAEEPFSGPFAAKITRIDSVGGEDEPPRVSLSVFYPASGRPEGEEHQKTNVPQSAEPTLHHWCYPPSWA